MISYLWHDITWWHMTSHGDIWWCTGWHIMSYERHMMSQDVTWVTYDVTRWHMMSLCDIWCHVCDIMMSCLWHMISHCNIWCQRMSYEWHTGMSYGGTYVVIWETYDVTGCHMNDIMSHGNMMSDLWHMISQDVTWVTYDVTGQHDIICIWETNDVHSMIWPYWLHDMIIVHSINWPLSTPTTYHCPPQQLTTVHPINWPLSTPSWDNCPPHYMTIVHSITWLLSMIWLLSTL